MAVDTNEPRFGTSEYRDHLRVRFESLLQRVDDSEVASELRVLFDELEENEHQDFWWVEDWMARFREMVPDLASAQEDMQRAKFEDALGYPEKAAELMASVQGRLDEVSAAREAGKAVS
jgi:hypothetical protein